MYQVAADQQTALAGLCRVEESDVAFGLACKRVVQQSYEKAVGIAVGYCWSPNGFAAAAAVSAGDDEALKVQPLARGETDPALMPPEHPFHQLPAYPASELRTVHALDCSTYMRCDAYTQRKAASGHKITVCLVAYPGPPLSNPRPSLNMAALEPLFLRST